MMTIASAAPAAPFPAGRSPATALLSRGADFDLNRLRAERLRRTQAQMEAADCGCCILYDPINVRYATDSRNMQVWTMHNPVRYAFVPREGLATVFDYRNCEHLSFGLPTVKSVRRARTWHYFYAVGDAEAQIAAWAAEIDALIREECPGERRVAIDRPPFQAVQALERLGYELVDAQGILERARSVKTLDEIQCMRQSVAVCEAAMEEVRQAAVPGRSENELWSILNRVNTLHGGEYIETKLLTTGPRTRPWYQESNERIVRPGELVAFDTDMIGPYGYDADLSRTFFVGPGRPNGEQKTLYGLASEQLQHNFELLRPGLAFQEFSAKAWQVPPAYRALGLAGILHGVGMCNEYPLVKPRDEQMATGYDGHFQPNMTVCLESYMAATDGCEGVKLEQMVLITEQGAELLSSFPLDERLQA